jgi:hypothetical protein
MIFDYRLYMICWHKILVSLRYKVLMSSYMCLMACCHQFHRWKYIKTREPLTRKGLIRQHVNHLKFQSDQRLLGWQSLPILYYKVLLWFSAAQNSSPSWILMVEMIVVVTSTEMTCAHHLQSNYLFQFSWVIVVRQCVLFVKKLTKLCEKSEFRLLL